jgi:hypothetical protein
MNKLNLSIGVLLVGSLLMGCGSKSPGGTAGMSGTAGAAAGSTGTAGAGGAALGDSGAVAMLADGTCKSMAFKHDNVCVCQSGTPKACTTACVDLKTDNDNCGACGTACPMHATCVAGVCGPSPTVAVPKPAMCGAMALAASGGTLYWTDTMNKKVFSMPAAGGTPTPISSTETSPTIIAVRGTTVFWLDGKVIRKSVAGAAPTVVYTSPIDIHGISPNDDGSAVYFTVGDPGDMTTTPVKPAIVGKVLKVATATTATDVALEQKGGIPTALAVQGTLAVYPCDINGDVDIATIGATPAQCWASAGEDAPGMMNVGCNRIARSQGSLNQTLILAAGANVVWVDGKNVKMNGLSATAEASNKSFASPDNNVHGIALGGTKVFFSEFDDNAPATGTVQKVAMMEMAPLIPLARNINGPGSVAVDGKKVFFSTADCEIQTTGTGE